MLFCHYSYVLRRDVSVNSRLYIYILTYNIYIIMFLSTMEYIVYIYTDV
jgi:hypothetical protein